MTGSARDIIQAVVRTGLSPAAKNAGFKKSGLNFHRRSGSAVHVLNVQCSQGNVAEEAAFYVNLGVALDALFRHAGKSIPDQPKEYECHFRARLEKLVALAPPVWKVDSLTNVPLLAAELAGAVSSALARLEEVSGPETLLSSGLASGDPLLAAQLFYVTERLEECRGALAEAAHRFQDRKNSTIPELVARLGFTRLMV